MQRRAPYKYNTEIQYRSVQRVSRLLVLIFARFLAGEQFRCNMGNNTTLRDDNVTKELVQLLIVADCKLEVAWYDTLLLIVTSSITSELEDFSREIFKHCGQVDWSTRTHTLGVVTTLEHSVNTTNGELETGFGRAGCTLGNFTCGTRFAARGLSGFTLARHFGYF